MEDPSFFDRMISHLRSTCKYYTGYPKDLVPSRVIHFTSEREFVKLLHEGYPVVAAFTIRGNYTQHLDKVLEEAAVEFYPHVKFMRVECPKYPGFCITRQKNEYPFIEIFHSPEQAANQGKVADPNITKYNVKVLPFNYDVSAYGFREFFKRHGIRASDPEYAARHVSENKSGKAPPCRWFNNNQRADEMPGGLHVLNHEKALYFHITKFPGSLVLWNSYAHPCLVVKCKSSNRKLAARVSRC